MTSSFPKYTPIIPEKCSYPDFLEKVLKETHAAYPGCFSFSEDIWIHTGIVIAGFEHQGRASQFIEWARHNNFRVDFDTARRLFYLYAREGSNPQT